jgi:predicted ATPase
MVRWAISEGSSQSGTFLRAFIRLGFNQDESGRIVWDGSNPNIAARVIDLNRRFALPGGDVDLYGLGTEAPVWWEDWNDVPRGRGTSGLLDRCRTTNTCPKIMETFGGAEITNLRASFMLVGTDAKADIPLPDTVRRYFFPGVTHGGGRGGFSTTETAASGCELPANPAPSAPMRSALTKAFVAWVTTGAAMPPSRYPTIADGTLVPETVASALGFAAQQGLTPTESLIRVLGSRDLLCVLDNCEHLIDAVAQLAHSVLRHCSGLRILATSRDVIGVEGEVTWRVPSMQTPDLRGTHTLGELRGCETVQLLVQRAQAARPGFELNSDNSLSVIRICQRTDGIPLAIELVAARVRGMSVTAIDERIADRFNLVTGGSRVSMPRQRTLQATFDWSYDLLGQEEKRVFRRLSVFAGGFTLDAAEAVCRADEVETTVVPVIDSISSLVDKSLVISQEGAGQAGRYRLLEPIRQYADAQLSDLHESEAVRSRHAQFFLAHRTDVKQTMLYNHQTT